MERHGGRQRRGHFPVANRCEQEADDKRCALSFARTFCPDISSMQRDKLFDDGKAEPQSTVAARERGIRLAKPVEYVRQELLLDARASPLRSVRDATPPFDDHFYHAAF